MDARCPAARAGPAAAFAKEIGNRRQPTGLSISRNWQPQLFRINRACAFEVPSFGGGFQAQPFKEDLQKGKTGALYKDKPMYSLTTADLGEEEVHPVHPLAQLLVLGEELVVLLHDLLLGELLRAPNGSFLRTGDASPMAPGKCHLRKDSQGTQRNSANLGLLEPALLVKEAGAVSGFR